MDKESSGRIERCPYCGAWVPDGKFHVFGPNGEVTCPTRLSGESSSYESFRAVLDSVMQKRKEKESK